LRKIAQIRENPSSIMSNNNIAIKNIGTVIGGALIGAATTKAWTGALTGIIGSFTFSEWKADYPKEAIIASVAFAAIKFAIDHYIPGHDLPSLCASLLPALALGDYAISGTVVTAWSALAGSTHFNEVALGSVFVAETLFSSLIGSTLNSLPNNNEKEGVYGILAASILGIGATTYFYGYNPISQLGLYAIPLLAGYYIEGFKKARMITNTILMTAVPIYGIGLSAHLYYSPIQAMQYNILYSAALLFMSHVLYKQPRH